MEEGPSSDQMKFLNPYTRKVRSLRSALRLLKITKSGRRFLILIASLKTFRGIVIISQALLLTRIIVDDARGSFSLSGMTPEILMLSATWILQSLVAFTEERFAVKNGQRIRRELRQTLLERIAQDDLTIKRERSAEEISLLVTRGIAELGPFFSRVLPNLVRAVLTPLVITIAIALGNRLVAGSITSTTALLILILTPKIYLSIRDLTQDWHLVERSLERSLNVLSILESPLKPTETEDHEESLTSLGRIKEIRWTDAEVIHDEDCSVTFRWGIASGGKMTLIMGPSGSGKTTLLQSLIRMHTLSEGRIFIETNKGTFRIEELSVDYWLDQIAWIPTTPHFVEGTIEENLKLIKPRANRQRLAEVLAQANLPVESLPNGLQTKIDQLDPLPSAGQLRRLALARAILKDAPIIFCDSLNEPIDSSLELPIQAKLKELSRDGKLVITISNNEEIIAMADRKIALDSGRIEPVRILESVR